MLKVSFAADKDVDNIILVVLVPLLDPLPPLVSVGEGRLVGDVIGDDDGVGTGVVKLSFDLFFFKVMVLFKYYTEGCVSFLTRCVPAKYNLLW